MSREYTPYQPDCRQSKAIAELLREQVPSARNIALVDLEHRGGTAMRLLFDCGCGRTKVMAFLFSDGRTPQQVVEDVKEEISRHVIEDEKNGAPITGAPPHNTA